MNQTDLFILGMIFGVLLFWQGYRWWRSFRLKKKVKRAKKGEKQALDLLESEGYEILELQKRAPICAKVDGVACKTYIAADVLVRKDGRVYVAEIKTGSEATKVSHAPTRRQLLEYFFIFKPYGILLVNMEQKKICKVEFSLVTNEQGIKSGMRILLWFLVGIIFGWLLKGGF